MKMSCLNNKPQKNTRLFNIVASPVLRFKLRKCRQWHLKKLKNLFKVTSFSNDYLKLFYNNPSCNNNVFQVHSTNERMRNERNDQDQITTLKCLMPADSEVTSMENPAGHIDYLHSQSSNPLENQEQGLYSTNSKKGLLRHKMKNNESSIQKVFSEDIVNVNSSDMKNNNAKLYELSGSRSLVVIKPKSHIFLVGIIELELLKGHVEILGYSLNKQKKSLLIFSLQGSSHLFIRAKDSKNHLLDGSEKVTLEKLLSLGLQEKTSRHVLKESESNTVFIISRPSTHISSSAWPAFFENHLSFPIFPPSDLINQETRPFHRIEHKINCLFKEHLEEIGFKEYNEIPIWSSIVQEITSTDYPRVVLCGGKSVGKSTLLRYLVNKCLHKWDKVLVIDFDLGQCEFTVPGCISVTLVGEPVLGPNYSHLKEPLRSVFLGEVDVTKCPESYIEGCKLLIEYTKQKHGGIPWIINTMGFTRGFGITLSCGIIGNVGPTHVIQIESKNQKLNFPSELNPGYVSSQNNGSFSFVQDSMDYKLYTIPSGSECHGRILHKSRGISPPEARNLVILSYLSGMLSSEILSLSQVTPYLISMEQVDLRTTDKYNLTKGQVAATMNGNLVALCCLREGNKFPNCHGFGVVRCIDWQTSTLFLITPMPRSTLSKINCLIKGNVALPESLYYNQGEQVVGHIPYVAHTSGRPTSRFARRDFRTIPMTWKEDSRSVQRL